VVNVSSLTRALSRAVIYRAPREAERCPVCASARLFELDLLVLRRPLDGRRTGFVSGCNDCGLVFCNPLPTSAELAQFYSPTGEWHARHDEPPSTSDATPRGKSWSRMFAPIRDELRVTRPPAGARVLDFGCGSGRLLDALQDCGWETWAVEPSSDEAFRRHRRLDTMPGSPTFDLIVCYHVLEHVTSPLALLHEFARAARPGGYLLVHVPRLDTLPTHRDYKYVINGRAHVTAYTWACLRGLLARAGWEPVAPPPDRVAKGRGRQTVSRLRVIARRVDRVLALPASPADEARTAVRRYQAGLDGRRLLERMRLYRLAARRKEAHRRRDRTARRAAKRPMVLPQ
jgi:SAM-dependent methyltransferase